MHYDGLAIAVHVLTLSAGLPDYCASGGEVVCNWGTHFPQSRLKQIKKKKGGRIICVSIQRNSLHPDYSKSNRAEEHC